MPYGQTIIPLTPISSEYEPPKAKQEKPQSRLPELLKGVDKLKAEFAALSEEVEEARDRIAGNAAFASDPATAATGTAKLLKLSLKINAAMETERESLKAEIVRLDGIVSSDKKEQDRISTLQIRSLSNEITKLRAKLAEKEAALSIHNKAKTREEIIAEATANGVEVADNKDQADIFDAVGIKYIKGWEL